MHDVFLIIRREFRERVASRSFLIGTLLFPVLMAGVMGIVRNGGEVRPGDTIGVELPPVPLRALERV